MNCAGMITELWRYPVSSIGGELVSNFKLDATGVENDRQFTLIEAATGLAAVPEKDKRWRRSLFLTAKFEAGNDLPTIRFPEHQSFAVDDTLANQALSDYFGFGVAVATYLPANRRKFPLAKHRHTHAPLHLLTTASLDKLAALLGVKSIDSRRFRPSALVKTAESSCFVENTWTGRPMRLGAVNLIAQEQTPRCGMTFISQPGLDEDPRDLEKHPEAQQKESGRLLLCRNQRDRPGRR